MPNPRLTVRIPEPLEAKLPADSKERSALVLELLERHFDPQTPEDRITRLERRIEQLEARLKLS
jgi:polyhydroxyalkanoate synthesis regulator phasin